MWLFVATFYGEKCKKKMLTILRFGEEVRILNTSGLSDRKANGDFKAKHLELGKDTIRNINY